MRIKDLYSACDTFEKFAQSFEKRNYTQLTETAQEQIERYYSFIPDQYKAQQIFERMNSIRKSDLPAANIEDNLNKDPVHAEGEKIIIQLEYFGERYPNILTGLGVNPNTLQTMINNLKIVLDSPTFSGFQLVNLSNVKPKVFEIDEWEAQQKAKKDLGF